MRTASADLPLLPLDVEAGVDGRHAMQREQDRKGTSKDMS